MKKRKIRWIWYIFYTSYISHIGICQAAEVEIKLPSYEVVSPPSMQKEIKEEKLTEEELKAQFGQILDTIFKNRNQCLVKGDLEVLKKAYNLKRKLSLWAYESEAIKVKYLNRWAAKQAVSFSDIHSVIKIRKVREREPGLFGLTCNVCTSFTYSYLDTPEIKNTFKLGTSHYIHLSKDAEGYTITKEWYTDPFADSLTLDDIKSNEMRAFILNHTYPVYQPNERVLKAIAYAHDYCGISSKPELLFKYHPGYINCNSRGGDCANFASQILYEGGHFKKTRVWNYAGHDGTKAWLNAAAFKDFMVGSGRGSYITKGSYAKIYKTAYKMRPGDFVAYEKKGRIVHISTVTGLDSKGYPLVTCHNTDRLLVPYDLGWSDKAITFHLIHMRY